MNDYLFVLMAYLSGSIPYGLIFSKAFGGIDVRTIGSGNIGATNVLRTGSKKIAALTLICDALKGYIPVVLADHYGIETPLLLVVAYAAILGHIFPCWLKFQGGKGVATALGVFWALSIPLGIFAVLVWGVTARWMKISSLSALCAFVLAPVFAVFFLSWSLVIFCLAVAGLILWTHRSNIARLWTGQETSINHP